MKMLECTNLMKSYKKKCVVNNLSFSVERGEVFAFLGSNGAGKTTTIKMI
ncbi:MAG: ATP-binding cassette domain-containing protein, partial [Acetatifactor sp.]|nr:ATP-binding cassette domain-containing protein [Acetatifactor sp.]